MTNGPGIIRKNKWEEKQLQVYFKRQTGEIPHKPESVVENETLWIL